LPLPFFIGAGLYGSIYLASNLLSAVLTNNAAAALMYPIAMNAVDQSGADRFKMSMILMLSASDYITSFGYQTNLMVYGPGEYKNIDYMKFGAPMQILLWLSSTAMVSATGSNWYVSWLICPLGFVVVASIRLTNGAILQRNKKNQQQQGAMQQTNGSSTKGASNNSPWQFDFASRLGARTAI
jgi:Na+/H+ antiporter NhaD/arsenite permease-like protein